MNSSTLVAFLLLVAATASACSSSGANDEQHLAAVKHNATHLRKHVAVVEQRTTAGKLHATATMHASRKAPQKVDDSAALTPSQYMTKFVRSLNGPEHEAYIDANAQITTDSGCILRVHVNTNANDKIDDYTISSRLEHGRYKYDHVILHKWQHYCQSHGFPGIPVIYGFTNDDEGIYWDAKS